MTTERGQAKGNTLQGIQGEGTNTRSKSPRQVFNDKYLELLKQNGWGGGYNVTTWLVDMCGDHGCVFIRVGYFVSVDIGNLDMIVIWSLEFVW